MHKHVEILIGRLATDPGLLGHFARHPHAVISEMGLELTAVEVAALVAIDMETFRAFAATLDARLRKATRTTYEQAAHQTNTTESNGDSR